MSSVTGLAWAAFGPGGGARVESHQGCQHCLCPSWERLFSCFCYQHEWRCGIYTNPPHYKPHGRFRDKHDIGHPSEWKRGFIQTWKIWNRWNRGSLHWKAAYSVFLKRIGAVKEVWIKHRMSAKSKLHILLLTSKQLYCILQIVNSTWKCDSF